MGRENIIRGALYLSVAASIWGGMFVIVKIAIAVIPPVPLVWMRYLAAMLVLISIGCQQGVSWKIRRRDWKLLFFIGLLGNTISIVTQETGTMLSSAQMGSIITAATPAFMVIFAKLLLGESLTVPKVFSVVLATIGVLLIVVDPENLQLGSVWGGFSLLVAALTWAWMSVLLKRLPADYSPIVITTYAVLVAVVLLAPYACHWLAAADCGVLLQPYLGGCILYLGAVSTAGAFILWNRGLQLMDASVGGLFFFFQPIVGTGLGWLLLGEAITAYFWLGSLLILIGVIMVVIKAAPTGIGEKHLGAEQLHNG